MASGHLDTLGYTRRLQWLANNWESSGWILVSRTSNSQPKGTTHLIRPLWSLWPGLNQGTISKCLTPQCVFQLLQRRADKLLIFYSKHWGNIVIKYKLITILKYHTLLIYYGTLNLMINIWSWSFLQVSVSKWLVWVHKCCHQPVSWSIILYEAIVNPYSKRSKLMSTDQMRD